MIFKSFIFFIVFLTGYIFFINRQPWLSSSQHLHQENSIRAQSYLYNTDVVTRNVVVGSSLSSRLVFDSLPDTYNLSLVGMGIFEGLRIITSSVNVPQTVLIETNFLLRKENHDFINSLLMPVNYYSNKYIVCLRADKQPIPILISHYNMIQKMFKKKVFSETTISDNISSTKKNLFEDKTVLLKMIDIQRKEFTKNLDTLLLNKQLILLNKYVQQLQQKGVRVVFFEMPVNYNLINHPLFTMSRIKLNSVFPRNMYTYINSDTSKYTSTDGIHLSSKEALKFSQYLKSKMLKN